MRAKRSFFWAITVIFVLCLACMAACSKKQTPPVAGDEVGLYYCDSAEGEYLLQLSSDLSFVLTPSAATHGTYRLEGENLLLTFDDESTLEATLVGGVIELTYEGEKLTFIRKTTFTVTFNSLGGSSVEPIKVTNGKTIGEPTPPSRSGFVFLGWYVESECTTPFRFDFDVITGDTELFASWAEVKPGQNEYRIDFDTVLGDQIIQSKETIGGKLYGVEKPLAVDGYEFQGWWISMYEDAQKLTYRYVDGTEFTESTTLYAVWRARSTQKLPSPNVSVSATAISYDAIPNADGYNIEITDTDGNILDKADRHDGITYSPSFDSMPAGDYIVKVTALGPTPSTNSDPTERWFKNKALPRVSELEILEPELFMFRGVPNAQKYYLSIRCGNPAHSHSRVELDPGMTYDFSGCDMAKGGIRFTVTATANGYADSVSRELVYNRELAPVQDLRVDETDTLMWSGVKNATNYVIAIRCGDGSHEEVIGNQTTFSLKECEPTADKIKISIYPRTKGYNSPIPTQLEYEKKTLATPKNVGMDGYTVRWESVKGATGYLVDVNGATVDAGNATELDLSEAVNWSAGTDYSIRVRANGNVPSQWSDYLTVRLAEMSEVDYESGKVMWSPVVGADYYEVYLGESKISVDEEMSGVTSVNVEFNNAGTAVIKVRAKCGDVFTDFASVEVRVYTVNFDTTGGSDVAPLYKATGDVLTLPSATKTNYDLDSWYGVQGGPTANGKLYGLPGEEIVFDKAYDVTMYAYWVPKHFTVTYHYGDAEDASKETESIAYLEEVNFVVPVAKDKRFAFVGWFDGEGEDATRLTDENGKGYSVWYNEGDTDVYAHYAEALSFSTDSMTGACYVSKGPDIDKVTVVVIPAKYDDKVVRNINAEAFKNCTNLSTIRVPNTISFISIESAFEGCVRLTDIDVYEAEGTVGPYSDIDGVLIYKYETQTQLAYYPIGRSGAYAIPYAVNEIGVRAFEKSNVTRITVPASVTAIRSNAFNGCASLSAVTFASGSKIEKMEDGVFSDCTSLSGFSIPKSVNSIGASAFYNCRALTEITIPEGVSVIADSTFQNCMALERVRVPATVMEIEQYAFYSCTSLTDVEIPYGVVEIQDYAFYNCSSLRQIVIPDSVTDIGTSSYGNAFASCRSLAEVTLGKSVKAIGWYAFTGCENLKKVDYKGTVESWCKIVFSDDSANPLSYGASLFIDGEKVTHLIIPSGVKELKANVFANCEGISEVTFPISLTSISGGAFENCNITTVNYQGKLANWLGINFIGATANPLCCGATLIIDGTPVEELVIPNGIKNIGTYQFYGCDSLTSVKTHSAVESIGEGAFGNCRNIIRVTLGEGMTKEIGTGAFEGCYRLAEVINLSPSLNIVLGGDTNGSVAKYAIKVYSTEEESKVVVDGDWMFYEGDETVLLGYIGDSTELTLPNGYKGGSYAINKYAFAESELTSVVIPLNVTAIGDYAFENCRLLTSVTVGDDVQTIGMYAFSCCESLAEVTLGEKVTSIGNRAFEQCSSLTGTLTIPATTESIGLYAFYKCAKLMRVVIGDGVTSIGANAFNGCTSLTSITLGMSLTSSSFGSSAFYGCNKLVEVFDLAGLGLTPGSTSCESVAKNALEVRTELGESKVVEADGFIFHKGEKNYLIGYLGELKDIVLPDDCDGSEYEIFAYAFSENRQITSVKLGAKVTAIGKYAFSSCTYLTDVELGVELKTIGERAFYYCARLKSIAIPALVKTLSEYAFSDCSALESVDLGEVETIESYAFKTCKKLTDIEFGTAIKSIGVRAFTGCEGLISVVIPESVSFLGEYAFYNCSGLKTVTLSPAIGEIGQRTFEGCTSLLSITIPSGVEKIGDYAFNNCKQLQRIIIPDSVTSIGASAFYGNKALSFAIIGDGVTDIGNYAFSGCESLSSIVMGVKVKNIGSGAFNGCTALGTVFYKGTAASWNEISINELNNGALTNESTMRYYYSQLRPNQVGKFWHYNDDGVTPMIW